MLRRASSLKEEACRLEEEAQQLQTEGLEKIEAVVAGSEAEVLGASEGSYSNPPASSAPPPSKKACHGPTTTVPCPLHQESTGPKISEPATGIVKQALEAASPVALAALEEALPIQCNPLHSVGGHQMNIQMLGWGLQRGSINLTCYNLHTCAQGALGGWIGVFLLWKILLQPGHIPAPQKESC